MARQVGFVVAEGSLLGTALAQVIEESYCTADSGDRRSHCTISRSCVRNHAPRLRAPKRKRQRAVSIGLSVATSAHGYTVPGPTEVDSCQRLERTRLEHLVHCGAGIKVLADERQLADQLAVAAAAARRTLSASERAWRARCTPCHGLRRVPAPLPVVSVQVQSVRVGGLHTVPALAADADALIAKCAAVVAVERSFRLAPGAPHV